MKSNWPTKELKEKALAAVEEHGQDLLKVKPIDAQEYGITVPTVEFYAELLGALCYFESGFRPAKTYIEKMVDKNGHPVVSRGLLQISRESANGSNYKCGITREDQLHDEQINLDCGVKIMSRWIQKDKVICGGRKGEWRGMARYWSPFRKPKRVSEMRAKMKVLFLKGEK